jgi:hypothetical protein
VEGNLGEDIYIFTSQLLKKMKARAKKKESRERMKKRRKNILAQEEKKYFCDEEKGPVEFCSYAWSLNYFPFHAARS